MHRMLLAVCSAMFTALAMMGIYAISGIDMPVRAQLASAIAAAVGSQMFLYYYRRRSRNRQ